MTTCPTSVGQAVYAQQQIVAQDYPPADPGADGDVKNIVVALRCAESPLAQSGQIGIVIQVNWHVKVIFELAFEVQVDPTRDIRRGDDYAGLWINLTWRAGTDRQNLVPFRPQFFDQADQALYGAPRAGGGDPFLTNGFLAVYWVHANPQLCPANIDCDDCFHGLDYSIRGVPDRRPDWQKKQINRTASIV